MFYTQNICGCCWDGFLMPGNLTQIITAVSDGGLIPHFQVKAGETFCYTVLNRCSIMYQSWLHFNIEEITCVPTTSGSKPFLR